ncbi:phosphotransferase family protein [Thermodesulfobacteriota bacterium]
MNETGENKRPKGAEFGEFLFGLASTVKQKLAPLADNPHLKGELYSLATTLKLLANEFGKLSKSTREDRIAIQSALKRLADLGIDVDQAVDSNLSDDELRGALADATRSLREQNATQACAVINEYVAGDLSRGYNGLMGIDLEGTPSGRSPSVSSDTGPVRTIHDEENKAKLETYLRREFNDEKLTIESVNQTTEGFAAETAICNLACKDERKRRVVARVQWPELLLSAIPQPIFNQAGIMKIARDEGLPIPEVFAVEENEDIIGAKFIVSEYVKGYVPTAWSPEGRKFMTNLRKTGWALFIDHLVTFHGIKWEDSSLSDMLSGDIISNLHSRLNHFEKLYRAAEPRPDPLIEQTLNWLFENIGQWGDTVLIHGDYRPGNVIYAEDLSVKAIIDFDAAKVSDVHEELGQCTMWAYQDADGRAVGMLEPDRFLEEYAARSGRTIDPAGIHYYLILTTFQHYLAFVTLARGWLDHGGDVRMARLLFTLGQDRLELGRFLKII